MASLDNLSQAIATLGADVTKETADVSAALADLRSQIDTLTAGAITQDQIDALTAQVQTADQAVQALDATVAPLVPVTEGVPPTE